MRPENSQRTCFDEIYGSQLEAEGLITQRQRRTLIFKALESKWENELLTADDWLSLCRELKPKAVKTLADEQTRVLTSQVLQVQSSSDNRTKKLLIELHDGAQIEACIILKGTTRVRATICVSSQVGCRMGCTFCATGTLGLKRNLTCGEIIEQYVWCYRLIQQENLVKGLRPIRNVVFMGMGEPLDNYDQVIAAVRQLIDVHSLAGYQITVSTVGYSVEAIKKLSVDAPNVSLALSLHAGTAEARRLLVPSSANVELKELLDACSDFVNGQASLSRTKSKRQKLLVEYCLIKDINDSADDADALGHLLRGNPDQYIVNIIPYNPTSVDAKFEPPTERQTQEMIQILRTKYNLRVYLRQECGQDVSAACGQLALVNREWRSLSFAYGASVVAAIVFIGLRQLYREYMSQPVTNVGESSGESH